MPSRIVFHIFSTTIPFDSDCERARIIRSQIIIIIIYAYPICMRRNWSSFNDLNGYLVAIYSNRSLVVTAVVQQYFVMDISCRMQISTQTFFCLLVKVVANRISFDPYHSISTPETLKSWNFHRNRSNTGFYFSIFWAQKDSLHEINFVWYIRGRHNRDEGGL